MIGRRGFLGLLGIGTGAVVISGKELAVSPISELSVTESTPGRIHIKKFIEYPFFYKDWDVPFGVSRPNLNQELALREQIGIHKCREQILSDLMNMNLKNKVLVDLFPVTAADYSYVHYDGIINARYIRGYNQDDRLVGSLDIVLVDKFIITT